MCNIAWKIYYSVSKQNKPQTVKKTLVSYVIVKKRKKSKNNKEYFRLSGSFFADSIHFDSQSFIMCQIKREYLVDFCDK